MSERGEGDFFFFNSIFVVLFCKTCLCKCNFKVLPVATGETVHSPRLLLKQNIRNLPDYHSDIL